MKKGLSHEPVSAILNYKMAATKNLEDVITWLFLNKNGRVKHNFLHFRGQGFRT